MSASLFIATPTANGLMLSDYVRSLAATVARLGAAGFGVRYATVDGPNVALQRDMLVRDFLASECTHLLFVDSDMLLPADLAETLVALGRRVVGAVYPRRALDLGRLRRHVATLPFEEALALSYDWNLLAIDGTLTVRDGVAEVEAIGTGFLLVERACFGELAGRVAVPTYLAPDGRTRLTAFFRDIRDGDTVWSHDYAFCRLWRQAGGQVFAYTPADIRHVGDFAFGLPFSAYLAALRKIPVPASPA